MEDVSFCFLQSLLFPVSWVRQKYYLSLHGLKTLSGFGEFLPNMSLDKNNCVIKIITQCYTLSRSTWHLQDPQRFSMEIIS